MKARRRRQIGARHVAWTRGAFRGDQARPANSVAQPANLELDGATRATRALTGSGPGEAAGHLRDLTLKAAAAGQITAEFA